MLWNNFSLFNQMSQPWSVFIEKLKIILPLCIHCHLNCSMVILIEKEFLKHYHREREVSFLVIKLSCCYFYVPLPLFKEFPFHRILWTIGTYSISIKKYLWLRIQTMMLTVLQELQSKRSFITFLLSPIPPAHWQKSVQGWD